MMKWKYVILFFVVFFFFSMNVDYFLSFKLEDLFCCKDKIVLNIFLCFVFRFQHDLIAWEQE
jgi:hypothetical protein